MRYEFNRPYLEAKDYQDNDALAVEATAYALQTIFLMEGILTNFFILHISFHIMGQKIFRIRDIDSFDFTSFF